jgi:hypothetical protein
MSKRILKAFDEYQVYYWSPKKAERLKYSITVTLKHNNTQVGTLRFYPDHHSPLPGDSLYVMSNSNRITLNFYERQYEHILDLIRNESPMWVSIMANVGTPGSFNYGDGEIKTSDEPVGEEET